MKTFEEIEQEHIKQYPYEVFHEDAEPMAPPPVFRTWREALAMQKKWNQDVSGHVARKRKQK